MLSFRLFLFSESRFLQAGDMIEVAFKEARSGGDGRIASGDVKRATFKMAIVSFPILENCDFQ